MAIDRLTEIIQSCYDETNGGLNVYIQDQSTPAVIAKFNEVQNATTLASPTVIDSRTIEVASATGFSAGRYVVAYSNETDRFYLGTILSVASTTITLDTPLDSVLPAGSVVASSITNMNVNGSVTPRTFGLRGSGQPNPISTTFDCTRILFNCLASSACDLSLFGNLTALAKGLVLRKRNGTYTNIFNVKTNADLAGIMFDFSILAAANPIQGQDGFVGRLTFNGQNRIGVVLRLEPGEDLELIVQDDLTGLTRFEVVAEGHIVED